MIDLGNSDNLLIIRTKIKQICQNKGIKQKAMLSGIGKGESYLSEIWTQRQRLTEKALNDIADYLDTTPEYLCGLTTDSKSNKSDYNIIVKENIKLRQVIDRLADMDNDKLDKVIKMLDIIE